MNGLTTNAIDLVSLRVPGSSIKEALLPTEQITVAGYMPGGWSFEAYYQMNESHIEIDEAGTFFGSEVASENGNRLIFNGSYGSHTGDARNRACGYLLTVGASKACNADRVTEFNAGGAALLSQDMYLYQAGLNDFFTGDNSTANIQKAAVLAAGAASTFGGTAGDIPTLVTTLGAAGIAGVAAGYENWDEYTKKAVKK